MNSTVKMGLKIAAAILIDVITLLLFFSVWNILHLALLPYGLGAILFTMILVNVVILLSDSLISLSSVPIYASLLTSTLIYFIAVMTVTNLFYHFISVRFYLLLFFGLTLFYVLVLLGTYAASVNNKHTTHRMEQERAGVADITGRLLMIGENLRKSKGSVSPEEYTSMVRAFDAMDERIKSSTPFGRSEKPAVADAERHILQKLAMLNANVAQMSAAAPEKEPCEKLAEDMGEIRNMVMNREKLMVV